MDRLATAIIGACGEHYVAAFLSSQGLIVAMPRGGVPGCDLLVTKEKRGRALRVQVKTGTVTARKHKGVPIRLWRTSLKVIGDEDDFFWYAFVGLNGWPGSANSPEIFFVPSREVVRCMMEERDAAETWPSFWLPCQRADDEFKGLIGLNQLLSKIDLT